MNATRLYLTFRHLELAAHVALFSPSLPYGSPAYQAALMLWCMLDIAAATLRDVASGNLATSADVRLRADVYIRTDPLAPHRATACNLAADVLEAPADILAALARAGVPVDVLVAACPDLGAALGIGEGKERGEGEHVHAYVLESLPPRCVCGAVEPSGDTPIPLTPSDVRIAMAEEPLPRGPDPVPFLAIIHDRNRTHQDTAAPAVLPARVGCGHAGNPDAVCSDCGWLP